MLVSVEQCADSEGRGARTLDMSLKTESCASLNSETTSCSDLIICSSSPTARVMRAARLLRKLWSMLSSHGEPGARNAL